MSERRRRAPTSDKPGTVSLPIPYGQTAKDLEHLDSASEEVSDERLPALLAELDLDDDTAARIMLAAALLYHRGAGLLAQCLDTALIWERG